MLKFFRRIRKKLIDEGNLKRYLLYALGEILLVMIGILLALQVNNWNQGRLNKNKELEIVQALNEELTVNKKYLYENLSDLEQNVKNNGLKLIKLTGPNPEDISPEDFLSMIWFTSRVPPWTPKTATFNKIINSEDFNLIRNDSMKTLLIEYQARLNWVQEDYNGLKMNGQIQEQFEKANLPRLNMVLESKGNWSDIFKNIEPSKFSFSPKEILSDKYFENIIVEALISFNYVNRSGLKLIKHIDSMQEFIKLNY